MPGEIIDTTLQDEGVGKEYVSRTTFAQELRPMADTWWPHETESACPEKRINWVAYKQNEILLIFANKNAIMKYVGKWKASECIILSEATLTWTGLFVYPMSKS